MAFNYQYYSWNEELDLSFDASNENRLVKVCIIKIWGDHLFLNYENKLSEDGVILNLLSQEKTDGLV